MVKAKAKNVVLIQIGGGLKYSMKGGLEKDGGDIGGNESDQRILWRICNLWDDLELEDQNRRTQGDACSSLSLSRWELEIGWNSYL